MTFSYDGSNFSGYQIQKNKRTVEEEIENVLFKLNHNKNIKIYASGRTDANVHANGQVAHFDFEQIDVEKLKNKLNKLLPKDIYVKKIETVKEDFHARYHEKKKEYIYKINCSTYNPFMRNYIYQYNQKLDLEKMKEAIDYFVGTHDFTSFTKASAKKEDMRRTIYDAKIKEEKGIITISFIGNGFLQYQVRNMVGTLVEVGEGKRKPKEVKEILEKKDRSMGGKTFSPVGLYLNKVEYL
jgi:tRNA pseudouridine38-40 synthase